MLFRTHVLFSITLCLVLLYFLEVEEITLFFLFAIMGTLFVDIDSKKSRLGRFVYFRPVQFVLKHRGPIHSLLMALFVSLLIAMVNKWAGFGFFVGYVSHLFLDCLSPKGVKLFWPVSNFRFRSRIKSGGIVEEVFFVLLLLGNIFVVGKLIFDYLF